MMTTDESHESVYIVQASPWQPVASAIVVTIFLFCLLCGVLLAQLNRLVTAGMEAQRSCLQQVVQK